MSAVLRSLMVPLRALRRPLGAVAGGWLLLVIFAAVFAPLLTPYALSLIHI